MIRFIDINNGDLYNGLESYIHWFPNQQSTNLIYTHKICFITNSPKVKVSLDSNVFKIIDNKAALSNINYNYIIRNELDLDGVKIDNNYIYMIYLSAHSEFNGEYITELLIDDLCGNKWPIKIGADFYGENESLYINLSNMGLELPSAIQNALYDINIREVVKDNITMNRKLKELLSNYWDVIANKGNYKSLINSLKWFEWGDLVQLQEVWKHKEFGYTVYDLRDLCSLLEDKYLDSYNGFCKTTYLALCAFMQKMNINNEWDDECNPELYEIVTKWGREDLILKMCLLGNFYETYFMPIHLDLIHATIENIVFTNTIKIFSGNILSRNDYFYQIGSIKCNIKDQQQFILSNVRCQVGPDTIFGNSWTNGAIIGVDEYATFKNKITDDELKDFYSQLYEGIGSIIKFECEIETDPGDFINESRLRINNDFVIDNHIHKGENGIIKIPFNILLKNEGSYEINIQFKTAGSNIYSKQIIVNVLDVSGMKLNVYKVKHLSHTSSPMFDNIGINKYKFSRCRVGSDHLPIVQYITSSPNQSDGIALNNILVLKGDYMGYADLNRYYYLTIKKTSDISYTICVSKNYNIDPTKYIFYNDIKKDIYRNDYGYFPEFHYLELLDGDKESNYNIYNADTIAVIPELPLGLDVDGMDWEFINVTTGKSYKFPYIQEPYVSSPESCGLSKGYYDIIFKFRVSDNWHTIKLDSAFRKL